MIPLEGVLALLGNQRDVGGRSAFRSWAWGEEGGENERREGGEMANSQRLHLLLHSLRSVGIELSSISLPAAASSKALAVG